MPHLHRFRVPPDTPERAEQVDLPEDEAHRAARVVRLRVGEEVALFDGAGREWVGQVAFVDRRRVTVRVESFRREEPPRVHLTLLQAWLKRDKHIEEIIRHGTELGVERFVFFRAAHSEKAPEADTKWAHVALEACKQCGRLWLPRFEVAQSLGEALALTEGVLLIATADAEPVPLRSAVEGGRATLLVGPEGDFTAEELSLAQERGAQPISLGSKTFRAEVAAFLGAALVLYEMGSLGPRG